ncbi:ubiquitin carboxyl-terminal hydrolase 8-like [Phyllopteryx taeniolatus]|uniref:ubiquitin carboxyl-terminal hydrolase 8-like n=1 Tax=Phyllopteryx taeniolatus TaxID=161469 RepID=UPI002AD300EA|nr:ubiquitin carboxyl-terminal hydrolase 8-like [Phyllopteryx taeniolatus]
MFTGCQDTRVPGDLPPQHISPACQWTCITREDTNSHTQTRTMKAKALSVKECGWTAEDCHLVEELPGDSHRGTLCLPNIFRSKKVKPFRRTQTTGPAYQVYYTARELLLEVLDRGAIRELMWRASVLSCGPPRPSHAQRREQGVRFSEEDYTEMLTCFSMVLQDGLAVGERELSLRLEGWKGVLKRNCFQSCLLHLSRLEDEDKLEALSAFCGHVTKRYRGLYTPGENLAVKKYKLRYQQIPCTLHLAILCDISSGFICNMHLYIPEQLRGRSKKPVVVQVVEHLIRPFCSHRHLLWLDPSVWTEGKLLHIFSESKVKIRTASTEPSSSAQSTSKFFSPSLLAAHLQGWTGPALLFPLSDMRESQADVLLPGLWVALHSIYINTFVLHTLQSSGRQVQLTQFTRTLASQLALDNSAGVPVLPQLSSASYQEMQSLTSFPKQRKNTHSSGPVTEKRLQGWDRPGVCGLDNSGNFCYLNAVLQCVCSTVPLVEHLLHQDTCKELARAKCRVAQVFVRLLEQMWLGRSSSCAPVEASSLLCSILPQFNNHSQQDAQELLLLLFNALHDDLKKVGRCEMHSSERLRRDQDINCASGPGESTIVSKLFEGQLGYMTVCTQCDHQTHNTQTFTVLSLPIPTHVGKCSIQDCLSLFFEQTLLTGGEKMLCSACERRKETALLTCLDKPPEILVLHLKRFGCKGKNQVKLRTNVIFSMVLDLSLFLSSSAQNTSCSSYRLYAVVNHAGHLNMGHYTALCHSALTRTWHRFNDSAVRELRDSHVQSPDAYVLLYSRKPFRKPKIVGLKMT